MNRRELLIATGTLPLSLHSSLSNSATSQDRRNKANRLSALHRMPNYTTTNAKLIRGSKPAADGFRYPAEWEKHECTIMAMPPPQNWRGYGYSVTEVRKQWASVANKLVQYEPVLLIVSPNELNQVRSLVSRTIELVPLPLNDGWSRDSGPMFLVNDQGDRRIAGFTFNGWGGKFPPFKDDALLKARLAHHLDIAMYPINQVMEGGAVAVDGEGTLITTEQCLLNKNRTASVGRQQAEKSLCESLAVSKVIWLDKGLAPDPITDGHVDGLAAFAEPGTVLLHTTMDKSDLNYRITQDAKRRLEAAKDAKGRSIEIVEVPLDGDISYINFYIGNGCVLVPATGDRRQDARPLGVIREVFDKDYDVVPINANILGEGGGGIHCITQQVPAV